MEKSANRAEWKSQKKDSMEKSEKGQYEQVIKQDSRAKSEAGQMGRVRNSMENSESEKLNTSDKEIDNKSSRFSIATKLNLFKEPQSEKMSKNTSMVSLVIRAKPKLNDTISIDALIEAKKALISATNEEIGELPYLYTFTLKKFCENINEKLRINQEFF